MKIRSSLCVSSTTLQMQFSKQQYVFNHNGTPEIVLPGMQERWLVCNCLLQVGVIPFLLFWEILLFMQKSPLVNKSCAQSMIFYSPALQTKTLQLSWPSLKVHCPVPRAGYKSLLLPPRVSLLQTSLAVYGHDLLRKSHWQTLPGLPSL